MGALHSVDLVAKVFGEPVRELVNDSFSCACY